MVQIPELAVYVSRDGQTFGPFSWEELWGHFQAGSVLGTDLAWYEGQPEWRLVQQLFVPTPIVAPMPVPVEVSTPEASAFPEAKPVGPLSYAGASEPHQLVDPLALAVPASIAVETPKADPKPGKVSKPKAKWRIAGIRWQDIELPGWLKYAAPVAVVGIFYLLFAGGPPPEPDLTLQRIGGAVRIALDGHKGELEDADLLKVSTLILKGQLHTKKLVDGLSGPGGEMLSKCTGVVMLDLSDNKMTDEGVLIVLSRLAGMSKLEELYLSNNDIKDFKPLEKLGSLKFLTIDGNLEDPKSTKDAQDALKKALPGITFSRKP